MYTKVVGKYNKKKWKIHFSNHYLDEWILRGWCNSRDFMLLFRALSRRIWNIENWRPSWCVLDLLWYQRGARFWVKCWVERANWCQIIKWLLPDRARARARISFARCLYWGVLAMNKSARKMKSQLRWILQRISDQTLTTQFAPWNEKDLAPNQNAAPAAWNIQSGAAIRSRDVCMYVLPRAHYFIPFVPRIKRKN